MQLSATSDSLTTTTWLVSENEARGTAFLKVFGFLIFRFKAETV